MHELSKSAYEKEIGHLAEELKRSKITVDKATRKLDAYSVRESSKDAALEAQENETRILQRELDKLVDELQLLLHRAQCFQTDGRRRLLQ